MFDPIPAGEDAQRPLQQMKKPSYPVSPPMREYLRTYRRERVLPVTYQRLCRFVESVPVYDRAGKPTLWDSVTYDRIEMETLHDDLKSIYALLRVNGDESLVRHLYIDRIDFCSFGNSAPFRVRIVNRYNENPDHFYIKRGDASRICGLDLEHLLSPNRLHFFTYGDTLVEEHIAGVPGDAYIRDWLPRADLNPVRVAKELVKFNERCFIRLLGDMRSYNFVAVITPDFEGVQLKFRPMDFDQQSYEGRKNFYLPQFFKDNQPLAAHCLEHLRYETARQYQIEEHSLILQRAQIIEKRLADLIAAMRATTIAPLDNIHMLRDALGEHFGRAEYARCETMADLVQENLNSIRLTRPA